MMKTNQYSLFLLRITLHLSSKSSPTRILPERIFSANKTVLNMFSRGQQTPSATPDGRKNLRKKLVQTLKGKTSSKTSYGEPMKVYLRVRPFTDAEALTGESQDCFRFEDTTAIIAQPPKDSATYKNQSRGGLHAVHRFDFTRVFGAEINQVRFFKETTFDAVREFVNGQNRLSFCYGVTNAGKTYTIYGDSKDIGILPRAFNILFDSFKGRIYTRANLKPKMFNDVVNLGVAQESKEESKRQALFSSAEHSSFSEDVKAKWFGIPNLESPVADEDVFSESDFESTPSEQFALWISIAEIYNEQIFDLLEPLCSKDKKRTALKLGDDKNGHPYIKGLKHVLVCNSEEAYKVLKIGRQNQRNASTRLNTNSSRSHCIFNLKLARLNVNHEGAPDVLRLSQFSFVDLAGSERYTKTENIGERLKEAGNINTSLMTLGKCVEQLKYNQNHRSNQKNVAFRESKLTRLFQVFFCGEGKISMIVNISQCAATFDETLHALKFSAIARKIVTVRVDSSSVEDLPQHDVQQLMSVIKTLQAKIVDEAMSKARMEMRIREEVAQEMSEQMAEMEDMYSRQGERNFQEEVLEKRIEILTNSVRKSQRKQRVSAKEIFEGEEYVPRVLYQREQLKVKEQAHIIECLKETIEKQTDLINELREDVTNGSAFVSTYAREPSIEEFSETLFCTPPSQRGSYTAPTTEQQSNSSKKGMIKKLEGLKDSAGSSISLSAKKLKKRIFHDSPSTSSNYSFNGASAKQDRTKEKLLSTPKDSPKRILRSRKL